MRLARLDGRFDNGVVDGLVNVAGNVDVRASATGSRRVQTGYLRSYMMFLALAAVGAVRGWLTYFVSLAAAVT